MASIKFLLVDDEKGLIEAMAQRLRNRGFQAHCVFSGNQALERLQEDDSFDVVVLDLIMPVLDGIETLKGIKAMLPLVEVVMLTGHADVHSAVNALKLGAFDYLIKPCELDDLLSKAQQAASRKKQREDELFGAKTKPYISKRERDKLISDVLDETD
jgi:DNA-binding NtrC family response regulator